MWPVLNKNELSIGQKLRWLRLLARTGYDKRFHSTVEAIYGLIEVDRPVIVDVGANVGNFVKACVAQKDKSSLVLAVEPSFYVFDILAFWARRWSRRKSRVVCRKVALSEGAGRVAINTPVKKSGSLRVGLTYIGTARDASVITESVPSISLDALLDDEGIADVHLVKMDVEGAEGLVIRGAARLFKTVRPIWFVELSEDRAVALGGSAKSLFNKFLKGGYRAFVFDAQYRLLEVFELGSSPDYLFVPKDSK